MQYTLNGCTQELGFRAFSFESLSEDRARTKYQVRADLSLIRTYGIRVQELPLLCLEFLERNAGAGQVLTFTEAEMRALPRLRRSGNSPGDLRIRVLVTRGGVR